MTPDLITFCSLFGHVGKQMKPKKVGKFGRPNMVKLKLGRPNMVKLKFPSKNRPNMVKLSLFLHIFWLHFFGLMAQPLIYIE